MPFRHATWVLLLLVPMIGVAFWPGYFSDIRGASFALHAHGLTASAWIALVIFQSWSIQARRNALHRSAGAAVLLLAPLFAAGGSLAIQSMAIKALSGHPFYGPFGAMLGLDDVIGTTAFVLFVRAALLNRKRVWLHGGYMLATPLLVLPPVLTRLFPPLSIAGISGFDAALILSDAITAIVGLLLGWRYRQARRPFFAVAIVVMAQATLDLSLGRSAVWGSVFASLANVPADILAPFAFLAASALIWTAWRAPGQVLRTA